MNQTVPATHLKFYRQHKIAPVRYDLSNMDAHLDRRFSLYNKLGLVPPSFKNSKVLEIAAGTGHNSLYLAQLMPSQLILLEPNEVAVTFIREAYSNFNKPHTIPEIICATLEDYSPNNTFDIVLCENWLGTSQHELSLLQKISKMVAKQGVLVLTTVSPIGFVPNLLRRFMASYLTPMNKEFSERTSLLVSAFGSHLATISAMTRSAEDWVQDCMINPAYFGITLSIPKVLQELGDRFEVIGTSPSFSEDWRWFKMLYGNERQINQHFLSEYWKKAHNFLDYRELSHVGESTLNIELEKKAIFLLNAIAEHEDARINCSDPINSVNKVLSLLGDFISSIPKHLTSTIKGLYEARDLMISPALINSTKVEKMSDFIGLFGRETAYISLIQKS